MKKLFAMILAAALVLGLVACGSGASSAPTSAPAKSEAAAPAADAGAATSSWPTDTVSMYVPAKAGGGTDMMARIFIQGMSEANGGNYIVINDVNGGGTVAAETVRNSKPDGQNLLMYHTGLCTSIASGQYAHSLEDFTICGLFITAPDQATGGIFVPGNSPFNTIEELIDYTKEHPGELMVGMQNGSSTQLITALIENALGVDWTEVEAGSNADKVTALMGNQIDLCFMNTTGNDQYVQNGDLKILLQWGREGATRSTLFPDTPLLEEVYPDAELPRMDMLGFIAGPKGMSEADVAEINRVMKAAIENPTVQEGYAKMATVVEYYTAEEATQMLLDMQTATTDAYNMVNGK